MNLDSTIELTLADHQRTKQHLHRYAQSLGYLDWATQPNPFPTYSRAPRIELDLLADRITSSYGDLFRPGAIPSAELCKGEHTLNVQRRSCRRSGPEGPS